MAGSPNNQGNAAGAIPVYIAGPPAGASSTHLNITTPTVLKAAPGTILSVNVVVAGAAAGSVNDCLTVGAAAAANQVGTIPNAIGNVPINFPCAVGIVIVPGSGQTLAAVFQ